MTGDGPVRTSPDPVGPVPDGGPHGSDRGERIAERLLSTVREDLGRADAKAAVLLSGTLALPAFLIGRHGPPDWRGLADVTLILASVLWVVAVTALVGALMPRTRTVRGRDGVTYFGDLLAPATSRGCPPTSPTPDAIPPDGCSSRPWTSARSCPPSTGPSAGEWARSPLRRRWPWPGA
ncbi:hypothetical protein HEP87_39890 [Streptomyces sp. S1D4-11]